MWADDVVVLSLSAKGLQKAIDRTHGFFSELDLSVNTKKTKVMVFNIGGRNLDGHLEHNFQCGSNKLEVTNEYLYLGIKLKSSGSFTSAIEELYTKASRAWFAISNTLYQHKKMSIRQAFRLFDSLITPIGLYGCEVWTPFCLKSNSLTDCSQLLANWEAFIPERLNQRICRMLLSVHKKSSKLAVLGELGRNPLLINAISGTNLAPKWTHVGRLRKLRYL